MKNLNDHKYPTIAPSLLAADKSNVGKEVSLINDLGFEFVHIDIMDGFFVPNISFSTDFVKSISKSHKMVNDVHIMVEKPFLWVEGLANAGADIITFHLEACENEKEVRDTIKSIHDNGVLCGLSIKPKTDVSSIEKYINEVDLVLVMSVEPGKGGQAFIEGSADRIKTIKKMIEEKRSNALIEVDGGINDETGKMAIDAGADILVAGSYLFGHDDIFDRARKIIDEP